MSTQTRRILIVDDDPLNVFLLNTILEEEGEIRFATDGLSGLDMAREWKPHLVLLDMEMPEMTGPEVLAELNTEPDLRASMDVVIVTAHDDPETVDLVNGLGATDMFIKPYDADDIIVRVQRLLAARID